MSHDTNFDQVEALNDKSEQHTVDHAALEGQDGLKDLNQQVRKEQEELKAGRTSGITGEFGKPTLIDGPDKVSKQEPKSGQEGLAYELKNVMTGKYESGDRAVNQSGVITSETDDTTYGDDKVAAGLLGWLVDEKEADVDLADGRLGLLLPGIQRKVVDFWRGAGDENSIPAVQKIRPRPESAVSPENLENDDTDNDEEFPQMDWMGDPEDESQPEEETTRKVVDFWNQKDGSVSKVREAANHVKPERKVIDFWKDPKKDQK